MESVPLLELLCELDSVSAHSRAGGRLGLQRSMKVD